MKLLGLEDEPDMATYFERGLAAAGHRVDLCPDGRQAFHQAVHGLYGVILVDRMVPNIDGLEVVKASRIVGVQNPALLVTVFECVGAVSLAWRRAATTIWSNCLRSPSWWPGST